MAIKYPKIKEIKNWSPEIENSITSQWKKNEEWNFNLKTRKPIYSIDTPPPYINSPIHMGHAVTYCFMDMFARYQRMKGAEVIFPLGLDRNGLPIEMSVEKRYNISAFSVGREKFIEYCEKLLAETSLESTNSFSKLGISFTSYKPGDHIGALYMTDAPEYRSLTQSTFIELYKKGMIYEDKRINNWDTKLQTTVADAEIDYKDMPSVFNYIKWKVKETGEEIIIATTRPELICTCGMIIYNPEDGRYKHLEGKTAISPVFGKEIPISEHPLAKIEKGTGLVMMCSAGDLSDIQFFREMNLVPTIAINKEGRMNEHAGLLNNLKIKEARQKIMEELKKEGLLAKQENIIHSTPVSERSGAEIEFIEMPEYYLKQLDFIDSIKDIANEIKFYPPESRKILDSWIDNISIDWPISRRRFYATAVPLWYNEEGYVAVPLPGEYYQPWKEKVPENAEIFRNGKLVGTLKQKEFKAKKWVGDERVLDTWFDSSISELFILKYKKDGLFFKKAYPATLRPQGKEIVRTWLYYTILRGYLETNKACFKDVWIHQHILDEKGRKMSKSLGNIIDPQQILEEYGAEAMRIWAATEGDLSRQDFACSKDKIRAELKTINKLVNMTRFITQFRKPRKKPKLTHMDSIFIELVEKITSETDKSYSVYDFNHPSQELRAFLWETFASHYIEIVKSRVYNAESRFTPEESESGKYTLYYLLERLIQLLYPIIPQITSSIASELKINIEKFPKAGKFSDSNLVDKIMELNSRVWKSKKELGISLREPISGIEIPPELQKFEKDIRACHNLQ
ncbi:valine--tRNA ligase [Candidatus Pacearchaeota archaeon]|nr:valine--tRNA ligase [Candidatus Pacearchaeota archaeon]